MSSPHPSTNNSNNNSNNTANTTTRAPVPSDLLSTFSSTIDDDDDEPYRQPPSYASSSNATTSSSLSSTRRSQGHANVLQTAMRSKARRSSETANARSRVAAKQDGVPPRAALQSAASQADPSRRGKQRGQRKGPKQLTGEQIHDEAISKDIRLAGVIQGLGLQHRQSKVEDEFKMQEFLHRNNAALDVKDLDAHFVTKELLRTDSEDLSIRADMRLIARKANEQAARSHDRVHSTDDASEDSSLPADPADPSSHAAPSKRPKKPKYKRSQLHAENPMFWKLTRSQPTTEDERLERALHFIRGCTSGRPLKIHRMGPGPMRAYHFMIHPYWRALVYLAIIVHCLVALVEPPATSRPHLAPSSMPVVAFVIECICIAITSADVLLLAYHSGYHELVRKRRQTLYVLIILFQLADLIAHAYGNSFRFSRLSRSWPLILLHRRLRAICVTIFRTLPHILQIVGYIIGLVVTYAFVGVQLFKGVYKDPASGQPLIENFDTTGSSLLTLFVLLTTENYPSVLYPAFQVTPWSFIYFASFILLGVYVTLSVFLAVIYDAYKLEVQVQIMHDRLKERRGLMAAFFTLYDEHTQTVSADMARKLLFRLNPNIDPEHLEDLLFLLDDNGNNELEILEWFDLSDIMLLQFTTSTDVDLLLPAPWREWFNTHVDRDLLMDIVESRAFTITITSLIVINSVLLLLTEELNSPAFDDVVAVADVVILVCFTLEMLLKVAAYGLSDYWYQWWNRFDLSIVVLSWLAIIVAASLPAAQATSAIDPNTSILLSDVSSAVLTVRTLKLVRSMRLLRLFASDEHFKLLSATFVRITPLLGIMSSILLVFIYTSAVVGMELFALTVDAGVPENFDRIWNAFLLLFQLFTTSNWHEIMYRYMEATTWYASWYFVTFQVFVVIILVNLAAALVLDIFSLQQQIAAREAKLAEEEEKALEELENEGRDTDTDDDRSRNNSSWRHRWRRKRNASGSASAGGNGGASSRRTSARAGSFRISRTSLTSDPGAQDGEGERNEDETDATERPSWRNAWGCCTPSQTASRNKRTVELELRAKKSWEQVIQLEDFTAMKKRKEYARTQRLYEVVNNFTNMDLDEGETLETIADGRVQRLLNKTQGSSSSNSAKLRQAARHATQLMAMQTPQLVKDERVVQDGDQVHLLLARVLEAVEDLQDEHKERFWDVVTRARASSVSSAPERTPAHLAQFVRSATRDGSSPNTLLDDELSGPSAASSPPVLQRGAETRHIRLSDTMFDGTRQHPHHDNGDDDELTSTDEDASTDEYDDVEEDYLDDGPTEVNTNSVSVEIKDN